MRARRRGSSRRRGVLCRRAGGGSPLASRRDAQPPRRAARRHRDGGDRRSRARQRGVGLRVRPAARQPRRRGGGAEGLRLREGRTGRAWARARDPRAGTRGVPHGGRARPVRGSALGEGGPLSPGRARARPRRREGHLRVRPCAARVEGVRLVRGRGDGAGARRVRRRHRRARHTRRNHADPKLPERARRLERAGRLGVRRVARPRARSAPRRRAGSRALARGPLPVGRDDRRDRRGADGAPGARVGGPPHRARPHLRHRGRVRGDELSQAGRPRLPPLRLRAHERHGRLDHARRPRQLRLRRRGRPRLARAGRARGGSQRLPHVAGDRSADRQRPRGLDAGRQLEPDAARADDEPAPRARPGVARRADRRRRPRRLPADEQELVDRRQAAELPVRDADRLGDQGRQARPDAARRNLHRPDARVLGLARRRRRRGRVEAARVDQLRQGPAGPARARLARNVARPLPQRPGRLRAVSETIELAHGERSGMARFASSEVHQPTLIENDVLEIQIVRDGRLGVATSNRTDDAGLRALAKRAAEAADSAPVDPDFAGLAPPAAPPAVEGFDEETAGLGAEDQARLASAAIEASELDLYGFFTSGTTELALVSSTGVSLSQEMTDVAVLALAAVEGASGYAEQTGWRLGEVDPAEAAVEAVEKAKRTRGAVQLEPGSYAAVLEPPAFSELLAYFSWDAFGGLGLVEERSYAFEKLGTKVFDERFSLADDALDPRGLPKAFDFEGTPKQRVQLVRDGVLEGVVWDRGTAKRAGGGQESTGHAPPSSLRHWGPMPFALSVAGGDAASAEELGETVGDGIYVTRLHYLSIVDPREGIITGMTRDGTFRIRGGKVADPLVNLRFTVSMPELLAELPGLTREPVLLNQNAYYDDRYATGLLSPAVATARFDVTGVGSDPGI